MQMQNGNKGGLKNTGKTEADKVCNIFDMAGNLWEWTTEYSTYTYVDENVSQSQPCMHRGNKYFSSRFYTSFRSCGSTVDNIANASFRTLLYVK